MSESKVELGKGRENLWEKSELLPASKEFLKKSNFPDPDDDGREVTISDGKLSGKTVWVVTFFKDPITDAGEITAAGEWILYFDPSLPLHENPVKADLHR